MAGDGRKERGKRRGKTEKRRRGDAGKQNREAKRNGEKEAAAAWERTQIPSYFTYIVK